ncbi:MAG: hypothetical protein PSW75_08350 [bacterium]|nr:hypothetical protein [bacterium]
MTPTAFTDASTFTVSNTDLLQTSLGSAAMTGTFYFFGTASLGTLTDGSFGAGGTDSLTVVSFTVGATVTFNLDLTASAGGYNLSQIRTYTGWDEGRDGQEYTLEYATASAPTTFLSLASVGPFGAGNVGNPGSRIMVTVSDLLAGPLVQNVAAIRFTFTSFENDSAAWREIDVIGTAVPIPEPATSAVSLALIASAALVFRRRQMQRKSHTA